MTAPGPRPKDHLDHVLRSPLPWRDDSLTECGREPDAAITLNELAARITRDGVQRTAYSVCNVCFERAKEAARFGETWQTWEVNPVSVLSRELRRVGSGMQLGRHGLTAAETRMVNELHAIAALIAAHRDEFDGYLAGLGDTVDLDRVRRERRAAR